MDRRSGRVRRQLAMELRVQQRHLCWKTVVQQGRRGLRRLQEQEFEEEVQLLSVRPLAV